VSNSPVYVAESEPTRGRQPLRQKLFYGWMVVGAAALTSYFSGPGQTYSISVFIDAYIKNLGLDRTMVSGLYSGATLIAGLLLFLVGRMVDKYGARFATVLIGSLLGLACIFNSFITGPIMLFFGFMSLRLFGQGSLTLIPSTLVPQWFVRHRGRALSFMSIGGLASGATLPILNNWLIATWSWHIAWRFWAGMLILVFVPIAWVVIRNRPEEIGLKPDGRQTDLPETLDPDDHAAHLKPAATLGNVEEVSWTLTEAMHSRVFWMVLFCAFVPSMVSTGITFNLFSILKLHGVDRAGASAMLSFVPIIGFACTFVNGFVLERLQPRYVISAGFLVFLVQLIVLWEARSLPWIIVFIVLWGMAQGFINISMNVLWPNYFGRRHLGAINSLNMMAMVIGSAFGPVPFGWAFDHFGSYQQILLVMMLFPLVAMVLSFYAKPPQRAHA